MKKQGRYRYFQLHLVDIESGMDGMTVSFSIKASKMNHIQEKIDSDCSSYNWRNSPEQIELIKALKENTQELKVLIEDYDYAVDEIQEISEILFNSDELLLETN